MIYFTGSDPSDGKPAVLKIPAAGGAASVVAKGSPFVAPDGVAVTKAGVVYVSDRASAGNNLGGVFRVSGTTVTKIADNVQMGNPAGVALPMDDSVLMVSSLNRDKGTDQVLLINLTTLDTGLVTKVVEANRNDAGGLHRASNKNLFSWCGVRGGGQGNGAVYTVGL